MSRLVPEKMSAARVGALVLSAFFMVVSPALAKAQQLPQKQAQKQSASPDEQRFNVTIRPRPRVPGPSSLQDMVVQSADGNVLFFVEWLLRSKTGSATGQYGDYHQSFFDIGKPLKEDPSAKYMIRGRGDFSMVMGRRYLGLDFDEIGKAMNYEPKAMVARFDSNRGFYQTVATAAPYDPLYSTYGKFNFEGIPCNALWGVLCRSFQARQGPQ
jgi:hypothetical protein